MCVCNLYYMHIYIHILCRKNIYIYTHICTSYIFIYDVYIYIYIEYTRNDVPRAEVLVSMLFGYLGNPRFRLKGSSKGDIYIIYTHASMDIDIALRWAGDLVSSSKWGPK